MLPDTQSRVALNTSSRVNQRIRDATLRNIERYCSSSRTELEQRLDELDSEWDIERTLEANAATFGLVGIALGIFVDRKWLALPAVVSGFLLQHALQGWCPPVPLFRSLGVRTSEEIEAERQVLEALRSGEDADEPDADADSLLPEAER